MYKDFLKQELDISKKEGDISFHYKSDEKANQHRAMDVYVDEKLASGKLRSEKLTEKIPQTF